MRIVVAMSGGVDSSVAAALLKQRGYDVVGIGLYLFDEGREGPCPRSCCGRGGMEDARRVAGRLNIPFHVLDFRRVFEERVVGRFVASYLAGETPNPCVACNAAVKFEALLDFGRGIEADLLATGHYARAARDGRTRRYKLLKGADARKDQSYFLHALTQRHLARAVFPLGGMAKEETRALAGELELGVGDRAESQDICFVGRDGYGAFIRGRAGDGIRPGAILDGEGRVVGEHEGLPFYTIGQRRGLGIDGPERMFVSDIDAESNTITVTRSRGDLKRTRVLLEGVNYISGVDPEGPLRVSVKTRYGSPECPATLLPLADRRAVVEFDEPQEAPAPGQSVVLYDGDEVVGGGPARRAPA